jgi:hypothetical protein
VSWRPLFADDPRPPRLTSVPRPGGGLRLLTILDPLDRAGYARVVARVAGVVERALGPEILANRTVDGIALQPWRQAWRRLLLERAALAGRGPVLVHTDVERCYPRIAPGVVERSLRALGADVDDVRSVTSLLDRFQHDGVPGLPIGPDPSAILANAVLTPGDASLREDGCPHVRWVDDVWAAARSRAHAERALERLRGSLALVGLALNEDKTIVLDAGDAMEALPRWRASGPGL